jgi:hypothetical protein
MVANSFKVHGPGELVDLDRPIWQDQSPLVLGWSDGQLRGIAEAIGPRLTPQLTDSVLMTAASIARSVVIERLTRSRGVYYSRARNFYRPSRYRDDCRLSWFFVTKGADALVQAGLVKHAMGFWVPGNKGRRSVMWSTETLVNLVAPLINLDEPRELRCSETVILRDRDDKSNVEYEETAEVAAMRDELGWLNSTLAQLEVRHQGHRIDIPTVRRIFSGDFTRGGRLYAQGDSWQNMPKGERQGLKFIIDGTSHPAVERDYANLHIRMAYARSQRRCPAGDLYEIDGFDRGLVKLAVNVLFNAPNKCTAIAAIHAEIMKHPEWRWTADRDTLADRVVKAIRHRHGRIKKFFHSDCGATFQRWDSVIAIEVMSRMIEMTGRCPLPIHDSFLCAEVDGPLLDKLMAEVLSAQGIGSTHHQPNQHPVLPQPTTQSYPLGGHRVLPGQMEVERTRTNRLGRRGRRPMTDEPDLTKPQEQVLRALMAQKLSADIDPTEAGGLADDDLAQQLGVSEEEIRHDIQALSDLGYIEHRHAESAMEDDWFRQVECDWQWPDGRYGNMTVHFYALAASSPQTGHTNVEASLAAYCSLEHANATPRPTLAAAQQLYEEIVEGAACVCGQCTADSFGAKAIHKLIDAYPDPIAVTDVEDYEEKDR